MQALKISSMKMTTATKGKDDRVIADAFSRPELLAASLCCHIHSWSISYSGHSSSFDRSFDGLPTRALQSHAGSQSALAAIGGYCFPSRSTLGSQVHHLSSGI